jgi:hypothetical protein
VTLAGLKCVEMSVTCLFSFLFVGHIFSSFPFLWQFFGFFYAAIDKNYILITINLHSSLITIEIIGEFLVGHVYMEKWCENMVRSFRDEH